MWVRLRNNLGDVSVCWFQFTHPCGCDMHLYPVSSKPRCFNSRTRVGATAHELACRRGHYVSIHAPVWVRLSAWIPKSSLMEVSIHAPVWVRREANGNARKRCGFQFTHPCGCDYLSSLLHLPPISFNSRTRVGATRREDFFSYPLLVSIHAPVWVRPFKIEAFSGLVMFQFTHPCGCD